MGGCGWVYPSALRVPTKVRRGVWDFSQVRRRGYGVEFSKSVPLQTAGRSHAYTREIKFSLVVD